MDHGLSGDPHVVNADRAFMKCDSYLHVLRASGRTVIAFKSVTKDLRERIDQFADGSIWGQQNQCAVTAVLNPGLRPRKTSLRTGVLKYPGKGTTNRDLFSSRTRRKATISTYINPRVCALCTCSPICRRTAATAS